MAFRKVIVVGLDGLEPKLLDDLLVRGELPHLARLREQGGYARLATTYPAQTPVAWSTFATGTNPGGHGIFDFIRRHPQTYLPDLGLVRYAQTSPFLPPRAVSLRRGVAVWDLLAERGIPATVLRCPCTFGSNGRLATMLCGMGVPDVRGGLGTPTFYTTDSTVLAGESERVVHLVPARDGRVLRTHLVGPRHPKTGRDCTIELTLERLADGGGLAVHSSGSPQPLVVQMGRWSQWLRVRFKTGLLQSVAGMVRFYLVALTPHVELYASPVNFDPRAPLFPISVPGRYAAELEERLGPFYTTGMVEEHTGLDNGRIDETAFLQQCAEVWDERERMLHDALERQWEGLCFCLFDTPDRVQHLFWRFCEPDHPANRTRRAGGDFAHVIEETYRHCDDVVGRVLPYVDASTLLIVLSDHGFGSFRRGVNLNTALYEAGLLKLQDGSRPGEETAEGMLRQVDWSATQAYALGLGSVYLNRKGREGQGIVGVEEATQVARRVQAALTGLVDAETGRIAVRSVVMRGEVYAGECLEQAPDLLVNFAPGYRASWSTALGGVPAHVCEDNVRPWSGDHIIDPVLAPGVLFMNRPFRTKQANLLDLAPTILAAFDVPKGPAMEGASLLAGDRPEVSARPESHMASPADAADLTSISDEQERLIRERLSGLGYI